jgi:hypothetical protein
MAQGKKKAHKRKIGGPFLAAAVFCENLLEDRDNTVSPIRILDRITVQSPQAVPPDHTPMAIVWVLVSFKAGDAPAAHTFRFVMNTPDGKRSDIAKDMKFNFAGKNEHGFNIKLQLPVPIHNGLFWFDVYLDDRLVTRMPLRVAVELVAPVSSPERGS